MAPSAKIGALMVSLGLDTAHFQSGAKQSKALFGTFTKGLIAGAAGAAASLLTVTAAINGTRSAMEHFGKVNDAALASGLDSETLQALAYQASLAGVNFEQLSGALGTFNKNSGLAAENKGKMVGALKALNPELLASIQNATTQEERLRLAADAIDQATSASEKAAISTALFGDAGLKLVSVFEGGASAMDVAAVKARELGIVVDRELIARADELGDEFDTATQIMDLQFKQSLIGLAPLLIGTAKLAGDVASAISTIVDSMNSLDDRSRRTLETQRQTLVDSMNKPVGFGGTLEGQFLPDKVKGQISEIDAELKRRAMDELRTKLAPRVQMGSDDGENLVDVPATLGKISTAAQTASVDLGMMASSGKEATEAWGGEFRSAFTGFFDDVKTGLAEGKSGWEAFGGAAVNTLDGISNRLLSMAADGLFDILFGAISGGISGGLGGAGNFSIGGMASYAGGGFTGAGSRSGGVDGMGGFPAILHPNETVIDHTKGGGGTSEVLVRLSPGLEAQILQKAAGQSVQIATQTVQQQSPSVVAQARRNKVIG